jgi:hypothetical protein
MSSPAIASSNHRPKPLTASSMLNVLTCLSLRGWRHGSKFLSQSPPPLAWQGCPPRPVGQRASKFPLLTLLDAPDFIRLATGNPKSGPTLPPGSGGSPWRRQAPPFPESVIHRELAFPPKFPGRSRQRVLANQLRRGVKVPESVKQGWQGGEVGGRGGGESMARKAQAPARPLKAIE